MGDKDLAARGFGNDSGDGEFQAVFGDSMSRADFESTYPPRRTESPLARDMRPQFQKSEALRRQEAHRADLEAFNHSKAELLRAQQVNQVLEYKREQLSAAAQESQAMAQRMMMQGDGPMMPPQDEYARHAHASGLVAPSSFFGGQGGPPDRRPPSHEEAARHYAAQQQQQQQHGPPHQRQQNGYPSPSPPPPAYPPPGVGYPPHHMPPPPGPFYQGGMTPPPPPEHFRPPPHAMHGMHPPHPHQFADPQFYGMPPPQDGYGFPGAPPHGAFPQGYPPNMYPPFFPGQPPAFFQPPHFHAAPVPEHDPSQPGSPLYQEVLFLLLQRGSMAIPRLASLISPLARDELSMQWGSPANFVAQNQHAFELSEDGVIRVASWPVRIAHVQAEANDLMQQIRDLETETQATIKEKSKPDPPTRDDAEAAEAVSSKLRAQVDGFASHWRTVSDAVSSDRAAEGAA